MPTNPFESKADSPPLFETASSSEAPVQPPLSSTRVQIGTRRPPEVPAAGATGVGTRTTETDNLPGQYPAEEQPEQNAPPTGGRGGVCGTGQQDLIDPDDILRDVNAALDRLHNSRTPRRQVLDALAQIRRRLARMSLNRPRGLGRPTPPRPVSHPGLIRSEPFSSFWGGQGRPGIHDVWPDDSFLHDFEHMSLSPRGHSGGGGGAFLIVLDSDSDSDEIDTFVVRRPRRPRGLRRFPPLPQWA